MSHHPTAAEAHGAHEDARSEHASALRAAAHEAEVHRLVDELWARRIGPLMASSSRPSPDFAGAVE